MFTKLHALAQAATLMVVVAREGADQLRVSVTPMKNDGKASGPELRPLSVVATPAELDAEFAEALAIWQAPRRSVLEQARDAAAEDDEAATGAGAPKKPAPAKKPAVKAAARGTPAAKTTATPSGEAQPLPVGEAEGGTPAGADGEPVASQAPAPATGAGPADALPPQQDGEPLTDAPAVALPPAQGAVVEGTTTSPASVPATDAPADAAGADETFTMELF